MLYIDLIEGKPAIDWERYDRDRDRSSYCSTILRFTHEAIAALDGSPDEKIQQLEELAIHDRFARYDIKEKDKQFCCYVLFQGRTGYGLADSETEAKTLAQADLLSILCDHPIDAFRYNKTWVEFVEWDS